MNALKKLIPSTYRSSLIKGQHFATTTTTTTKAPKKNVMELITQQQIEQRSQQDQRHLLFSRKNPNGIKPGSVVVVETLNGPNETTTSSFMGICIAIRRKGIDTSFTLRNLVMRVGVEQRYSLYSPLIQSIKVVKQTNELKVRRAKLFYLRDQPKVFQPLQALWRQEQTKPKN
ncbi:translation protein SH3-like domain-containing protein [Cunninghamella echinulata]|nr:translation protein SH3-like domain-containing protein [Cunninghamella echinulata]